MRRTRRPTHRPSRGRIDAMGLAVVALTAAVVTACGTGTSGCSDVGADSGVILTVEPGLLPRAAPVTVTACVDGICQDQSFAAATSPMAVAVTPVRDADVTVTVSLTARGRQIFTGRTTTRTVKVQPNGPGCAPTVWEAKATAQVDGRLVG